MPAERPARPAVVDPPDTQQVLRDARAKFVAAFPSQIARVAELVARGPALDPRAAADLHHAVHRLAGFAGTIGFPTVSARASELEDLIAANAPRALDAARAERPDLILLDIELPGLDGYSVCRLLKADPVLAPTPVVFMTTRSGLDDRLAGLTLGADEFLTKPLDMREVLLRVRLLGSRAQRPTASAAIPTPSVTGILAYKDFLDAARTLASVGPVAMALVRVPPAQAGAAAAALAAELRRRDVEGWYDAAHLLIALPGFDAAGARDLLAAAIRRLASIGIAPLHGGVAASPAPGSIAIETLIGEADEALAGARNADVAVALRNDRAAIPARRSRIVVAEDDPEVVRILDAQLRQAGFETTIAFNGARAMEAVSARQPDVLILDLLLPQRSGFEVLADLRRLESRPRVMVLSARDRNDDVARAFELGADDYLIKPFSPQELRARISRLLR